MFKLIAKMGCISPRPIKHPKKPLPTIPNQTNCPDNDSSAVLPTSSIQINPYKDRSNSIVSVGSSNISSECSKIKNKYNETDRNNSRNKKSIFSTLTASNKNCCELTNDSTSSAPTASQQPNSSTTNVGSLGQQQQPPHSQHSQKIVIALYAYESRDEGELSFEKNEKLVVLDDIEPDWWLAHKLTQPERKGYIPMNFVVSNVIETEE